MTRYIFRKLAGILGSLFCVATLTFFLMKAIPGDPFTDEKALPKEIHESLREHYGLNAPLSEQYVRYLKSIVTWNFGPSLKYKGLTVNEMISSAFPISCILGLEALAIATTLGVTLGALSATYRQSWLNKTTTLFVMLGISLPSFASATLLQYFLAIQFEIFPVARWGTPIHTVLPALSLAVLPAAFIARLVQGQMSEILKQDFVKVCRAKGMSDFEIMWRHVIKNSLLPMFAYLGQLSGNILVGSFIVEKIFSIPGLGQWFVKSVMNRDYSVIMGLTVFYSLILVTMVLFFDLLSFWVDPRIRTKALLPRRKAHVS